jgi:pimeloyl-ACP methyl ester carboxylesterase
MATYVLIHGSWQGGWIWKPVAERLRAQGHTVYHPSMDGCAERQGSQRPGMTLDTFGREVADLLSYEDLKDVILVGTSRGGAVVPAAAERAPDRIGRLVFVDALVPKTGEVIGSLSGRTPDPLPPGVYAVPPSASTNLSGPGGVEGPVAQWAAPRFSPCPLVAMTDPVDLREFWSHKWQADVLRCIHEGPPPEAHQRRTAELLGASYTEMVATHYPMLSHPDELAAYLAGRA